jgi:hypothetical protein
MLLSVLFTVMLPFLAAVDPKTDPMPTPLMRVVEPSTVRPGAEVVVTGDNLGKAIVSEVYLTASEVNTKVEVLAQTNTSIKFKVPAGQKPGAYRITVLMNSAEPTLIEEPVRLVIEE